MGYEILGADFGDFITSVDKTHISSGEDTSQIKLTTPKGNIQYKEQVLREYLSIIEGYYHMENDMTIAGKGDSALLEIQFNLSDKAISYQDKSGVEHVTQARSGNIAFLAAEENEARILFQKESSYHTFDVHLPLSLLNHYAGESKMFDHFLAQIHRDISANLLPQNVHISPAIYNIIQDIKACTYEGLTRKIYLESKVYEIIALLYENVEQQKEGCTLGAADQEKIHWAASIIRDNLEKPLTIIELAHRVGINQTKLKTGFRTLFQNTVFGYLQDIRMHQAKRYLLDTDISVQEIGMRLGYQNTSNFSIAFKKIHGYSPMKLRER
ncbi:helix-turn-helix transcriptional regulator [Parapedobacter sp. SGR-10]|uniref:helix-turn-helix transcriptional regulator n=1 Tax=Parapedobacter sp. SGR-10 TaxID=2710879 RepID=UPI0013D4AA57|nr:AraC family transcriptional regulator [Parapedobacter sp. SGR-10]NGF57018.1 helix-turn-helix transcriptional regulator [Parapedobacter sp. SGR-10]